MKIGLKIDKLSLSTPKRIPDIYYSYKDLPGYKPIKHINTSNPNYDIREEVKDFKIIKYEKVIKYCSLETGNPLIICHKRKKRFRNIPPIYIIFYTDYFNKITYPDAIKIERFFEQHNVFPLRVSEVHFTMDIITKNKIGLYDKIIFALKPGTKRQPNPNEKLQYKTSKYFGDLSSGNQLIIYDKAVQLLKEKRIEINEDVCRLELKMRMHKMNNFIRTIDQLAVQDWSFIYPKYYSFHYRTKELKQEIKDWRLPIWELRDIMRDEYEVWPSNFYRDYLINHPQLSISVPKALARYRWKNDVNK